MLKIAGIMGIALDNITITNEVRDIDLLASNKNTRKTGNINNNLLKCELCAYQTHKKKHFPPLTQRHTCAVNVTRGLEEKRYYRDT